MMLLCQSTSIDNDDDDAWYFHNIIHIRCDPCKYMTMLVANKINYHKTVIYQPYYSWNNFCLSVTFNYIIYTFIYGTI